MRKVVARPNPTVVPAFLMPVHIRSAGYNEAPYGWEEYEDPRPLVQIFWCIQGTAEFILPDGSWEIRPGEVFIHLPMEVHHHRSTDPRASWRYYWFTFDGDYAEKFMLSYGYPRKNISGVECPTELFSELEILVQKQTNYARRHALAIAAEILARIGGMDDSTPVESLIRRFMALVRENMRDPSVTVNDLAKKLGVHRMTLNKHFKEEMEMTPGKYLDSIRLQHAMRLLRDTPLSLKEVSERSGIINQSYFCRLIREATGVSPGEYREKFRSPTVCGEQLATLDKQRYGR